MDQKSDFQRAVQLLVDNFAIIDLEGQLRYLNLNNVNEVLHGSGNPLTTKMSYYVRADIRIQQERSLTKSELPLEETDFKDAQKIWARSPHTEFYKGIAFNPKENDSGILNLWRGHAIKPKEGNCDIINDLLFNVLSNQSQEKYNYLLSYLAHALQKPEVKPEIMPVFYGGQGTGKGSFFRIIEKIWPYTTLLAQNVDEVVGTYTGSMERAFFVLLDEALFNEDKKSSNALKTKISEPKMRISEKYQPNRTIDSFHRFIAATNNEKFANIARDDRRFFICEVSDVHKQDKAYFKRFHDALKDDVMLAAFVHKLMTIDLSEFEVRERPLTREHAQQKLDSLEDFPAYCLEMLHKGQFSGDMLPVEWNGSLQLATKKIKEDYKEYNPSAEKWSPVSERKIIGDIKKIFPSARSARWREGQGEAVRGITLPSLKTARQEFAHYTGCVINWENEDLVDNTFYENSGTSGTSGTEPH